MSKPYIHFTWIGPPQFDTGGHDVMGPESFEANFAETLYDTRNPMIFWCQAAYLEAYQNHFRQKNVTIEVKAIETFLQEQLVALQGLDDPINENKRIITQRVLDTYNELSTMNEGETTISAKNCVRIKDIFSTFLLSAISGYVLDTNVCCIKPKPRHGEIFSPLREFMFPVICEDKKIIQVDVWMYYAPEGFFGDEHWFTKTYFEIWDQQEPEYKSIPGYAATSSLHKLIDHYRDHAGAWQAILDPNSGYISTHDYLYKEHFNTHQVQVGIPCTRIQRHLLVGDSEKVKFDLDHGISPNDLVINPSKRSLLNLVLDCIHHYKDIGFQSNLSHLGKFDECMNLLLEYGANPNDMTLKEPPLAKAVRRNQLNAIETLLNYSADPNLIFYMTIEEDLEYPFTPIIYAIFLNQEEVLALILEKSKIPIDLTQIIDETPLLVFAAEKNCGLALLLEKGKNLDDPLWEAHKLDVRNFAQGKENEAEILAILDSYTNQSGPSFLN